MATEPGQLPGCAAMADAGKPSQGKAVLNSAERDELALLRRRIRQFEQEPDHPGRGCGLVRQQGRQDVHRVYELANANQAHAKVATMCRMRVSTSGCCTGRDRALSPPATDNTVPAEHIRHTLADSHQTCGMARMRAELRDQGPAVRRKRAARLVCIRAISLRRGLPGTAHRQHGQNKAPDPARGGPNAVLRQPTGPGPYASIPAGNGRGNTRRVQDQSTMGCCSAGRRAHRPNAHRSGGVGSAPTRRRQRPRSAAFAA